MEKLTYSLSTGVTHTELREMFELDTNNLTGSGLRWRNHPTQTAKSGTVAGSRRHGKQACYWRISLNGKSYNVHHIVAFLAELPRINELRQLTKKGKSNVLVIDHINDGTYPNYSNHPKNLEVVTSRENTIRGKCSMRNQRRIKNAALLGASLIKGTSRYEAGIRYKGYSIKLGSFKTELEAHHAYLKARERIGKGMHPKFAA
ncbi:hypothetical protein L9G16_10415 [Shewanella sp. A25]|nr:hypothetical protein [Shewanella shenzhenensis]